MTRVIPISVVTDTICPWCYIGKKRLETAMTNFKQRPGNTDVEFAISYEPYQLSPDSSKEGVNKIEAYEKKMGKDRVEKMIPYMKQVGQTVGIQFSYGGLIGNTFDSHRLVRYAGLQSQNVQNDIVNKLYRAYFEEEKNIADVDLLVEIGVSSGLDATQLRELFASESLVKETQNALGKVKAKGISGVPHFTIGETVEVSGGQEPQVFEAYFDSILPQK
ncbi:thioredoxin-like protein [Chytriomyces cf. hyalinus JEL632]|nr:thioredoxin-like protein [Chytriomyces cf. hyalinus JEL632]